MTSLGTLMALQEQSRHALDVMERLAEYTNAISSCMRKVQKTELSEGELYQLKRLRKDLIQQCLDTFRKEIVLLATYNESA